LYTEFLEPYTEFLELLEPSEEFTEGLEPFIEPSSVTNEDGSFQFTIPLELFDTNGNGTLDPEEGQIVVINGIDTTTSLPQTTPLTAPIGSTVVTPLTTLVSDLYQQGTDLGDAEAQVKAALGIPAGVDLLTFDAIAALDNGNPIGLDVFAKQVQVQNIIVQVTKLIDGASNFTTNDIAQAVIRAIANQTATTLDLSDASQLATILTDTLTELGLTQFLNLVQPVAGVIAANNAEIEAIANNGTLSLEDAKQAIIAVQFVAQGDVASDLFELGAGTTSVLAADNQVVAIEDTVLEISVNDLLSNDQSVNGAALAITSVSLTSGSGTVVLDDRGTATTSDDVVRFTPAANFFNPDTATYESNLAFFNDNPELLLRPVFEYTVSDGNGNTDTAEAFITVNSANDAPVLNPAAAVNFVTYNEDPTTVPGTPVATLLGAAVTDVDLNAAQGIAITATTGSGTWQYSTNNGTSWTTVGTVGNASALLLAATTLVRFIPAANVNRTAALTYRAWDQTSGTVGAKVDTSLNGGTTGFSAATATSIQAITAVNDAPVNALPGNQSVVQGATRVFSAANGNAITVSDVDAQGGIEQVTVAVTQGQLALGSTSGLTSVAGNGTNSVTIQGTVATLNAALNGLAYTPTPQAILAGAAVLTVTTNDLGNSGGAALSDVDSLTIAVTPQNGIFGTNNGEQINGTRRNDTIFGLGGNDRIFGKGGNDIMDGGQGNDIITGNGGNDFIVGGEGNDIIYGKGGQDTLFGGNGNDIIYSGGGRDFIDGGAGNDTIYLSGGRNIAVMRLGDGTDTIIGYRSNVVQFDLEQLTFGQLTIAQTGRDVQIRNGSEILAILTNTQTSAVTASNFI
jgi:hypothetical protein